VPRSSSILHPCALLRLLEARSQGFQAEFGTVEVKVINGNSSFQQDQIVSGKAKP
jgi:hypothetical protein